MSTSSVSTEAEDVFAVGMHAYIRTVHMFIYSWSATQTNTNRKKSTHTNASNTNHLIPFPSLSEWDEGLLRGGGIYTQAHTYVQCGSLWQLGLDTVHLVAAPGSWSPHLLACGPVSPCDTQSHPAAGAQTYTLMHPRTLQ